MWKLHQGRKLVIIVLNILERMRSKGDNLPLRLFVMAIGPSEVPDSDCYHKRKTKSDNRAAGVGFVYHEYDYRPN